MNSKLEKTVQDIERDILDAQVERWMSPMEYEEFKKETRTLQDKIRAIDSKGTEIDSRIASLKSIMDKMGNVRRPRSLLYALAWYEEMPETDPLLGVQSLRTGHDATEREKIPFKPISKSDRYKVYSDVEHLSNSVIKYLDLKLILSHGDQALVLMLSDFLVETIKIVSYLGKMRIDMSAVVLHAKTAVDNLRSTCTVNGANLQIMTSTGELKKSMKLWESSIKSFASLCMSLNATLISETEVSSNLNTDTILLEEVEQWNTAEDYDLISHSLSSSGTDDKKLNFRVASHIFTYEIISNKFKNILKSPVLFEGMARSKSVRHCGHEGGFANVYVVELIESLTIPPLSVVNINGVRKEEHWHVDKVAVKVAKSETNLTENAICVRVARELRVWNRMRHENILPLIGLWENFISSDKQVVKYSVPVSPYFEDGDLQQYIKSHNVSLFERLSFLRDIAGALAYMHNFDFEVVHGDLRAANVLVKRKRAFLCDFGLSHLKDGVFGFTTKAHGNERWIAPEQLVKNCKPTPEGDIYSFGSVMLEVLSGEMPWASEPDYIVLTFRRLRNLHETAPRPDKISNDSHWNVIRVCWKFSPELRPVAEEVQSLVEHLVKEAYAPSAMSAPPPKLGLSAIVSNIQIEGELSSCNRESIFGDNIKIH